MPEIHLGNTTRAMCSNTEEWVRSRVSKSRTVPPWRSEETHQRETSVWTTWYGSSSISRCLWYMARLRLSQVSVSETCVPRSCLGCQHRSFESQERETNFKLVPLWTLSEKPAEVRFLQKGSEFNSLHPLGRLRLPVTPALRDPVPSF